ncbi:DUF421 domain-containing protein [Enterococcus sp. LJL98]
MSFYSPIILKLALGIMCLVLQINLLGKANLAPTSAMDQIQNYVLGGIIGGIIYSDSISILQFILVLLIWTILVLSLKFAKEHNRHIKNLIDGRPKTLIHNGKVDVNECLRSGISANDLMFKLRANSIYEIETVKKAVLEQNGQLTIIEYGDDMIRYPIIVDGQANNDVLELIKRDEEWLLASIQEKGFDKISEIYLGEYLSGKLNLYSYQ